MVAVTVFAGFDDAVAADSAADEGAAGVGLTVRDWGEDTETSLKEIHRLLGFAEKPDVGVVGQKKGLWRGELGAVRREEGQEKKRGGDT